MTQFLRRLWLEKQAEALSEYALLLILICLTVLAGAKGVATTIDHFYSDTSSHMASIGSHLSAAAGLATGGNAVETTDPSTRKDKKRSQN